MIKNIDRRNNIFLTAKLQLQGQEKICIWHMLKKIVIKSYLDNCEKEMNQLWYHIGEGVMVILRPQEEDVHICGYGSVKGGTTKKPQPLKNKELFLKGYEIGRLQSIKMETYVPQLAHVNFCMCANSHKTVDGIAACSDCTPFKTPGILQQPLKRCKNCDFPQV